MGKKCTKIKSNITTIRVRIHHSPFTIHLNFSFRFHFHFHRYIQSVSFVATCHYPYDSVVVATLEVRVFICSKWLVLGCSSMFSVRSANTASKWIFMAYVSNRLWFPMNGNPLQKVESLTKLSIWFT